MEVRFLKKIEGRTSMVGIKNISFQREINVIPVEINGRMVRQLKRGKAGRRKWKKLLRGRWEEIC